MSNLKTAIKIVAEKGSRNVFRCMQAKTGVYRKKEREKEKWEKGAKKQKRIASTKYDKVVGARHGWFHKTQIRSSLRSKRLEVSNPFITPRLLSASHLRTTVSVNAAQLPFNENTFFLYKRKTGHSFFSVYFPAWHTKQISKCCAFCILQPYREEAVEARTKSAAFFAITAGVSEKSAVEPSSSAASGSSVASCEVKSDGGM